MRMDRLVLITAVAGAVAGGVGAVALLRLRDRRSAGKRRSAPGTEIVREAAQAAEADLPEGSIPPGWTREAHLGGEAAEAELVEERTPPT